MVRSRLAGLLAIVACALSAAPLVSAQSAKPDPVEALVAKEREHMAQQRWYAALKVARKILAMQIERHGEQHAASMDALREVAMLQSAGGDFSGSNATYRKLFSLIEKKSGKESIEAAQMIPVVAAGHTARMEYDVAEALYRRMLRIYEKQSPGSDELAMAYETAASLLMLRHAFADAEDQYANAIRIYTDRYGEESAQVLGALMHRVFLYIQTGDRRRGTEEAERIEKLTAKLYGTLPVVQVGHLSFLVSIHQQLRNDKKVKALARRVEAIYQAQLDEAEKTNGKDSAEARTPLWQLASLWQTQGQLEKARTAYLRLLKLDEKLLGADTMGAAVDRYPLSDIEAKLGNYEQAVKHLLAVKRATEKQYKGWYAASPSMLLAELYRQMGKFPEAIQLTKKVLGTAEEAFGPRHPITAMQRERLAMFYLGAKKAKAALRELSSAMPIEEAHIALILSSGTEADNRQFLSEKAHLLHLAVTLNADHLPDDASATRLGLATVLSHKGRLLDASANTMATLRKRLGEADKLLLDDLSGARAELARLILSGAGASGGDDYESDVAQLEAKVRGLEAKARKRSTELRIRERPVDVASVQKALPKGAVLVEVVAYRAFDPRSKGFVGDRRYGAYVMARTGNPTWVELGPADGIDDLVTALREELSTPDGDYAAPARKLYARTFGKLTAAIGGARQVLIAPDGALNLIPFGALIDGDGAHLIERFSFSYLSSGRDLLRLAVTVDAKQGAVIVADPRFDAAATDQAKADSRGQRAAELRSMKWERLPGTAEEAALLSRQLSSPTLLEGDKATESAVKKLRGPRILHLATHGFFLPAEEEPAALQVQPSWLPPASAPAIAGGSENPLLRSGLVLSGANQLSSGREDGVLTGLEAAGMDLWGTQLVVLSACETGVGKVAEGDGVYGLRRALVIAGAESQVMSLWQVDDRATRDLMGDYYERLAAHKGRSEALRQVQLAMLAGKDYKHPYYWASFIFAGQWAPLRK